MNIQTYKHEDWKNEHALDDSVVKINASTSQREIAISYVSPIAILSLYVWLGKQQQVLMDDDDMMAAGCGEWWCRTFQIWVCLMWMNWKLFMVGHVLT